MLYIYCILTFIWYCFNVTEIQEEYEFSLYLLPALTIVYCASELYLEMELLRK